MKDQTRWSDRYWTPENLCARCGHPRNTHLGQPETKGGELSDDSGWCSLPAGTCIFHPCDCREFAEPGSIADRSDP